MINEHFFVNGQLHGDHMDSTGAYQRQFHEIQRSMGLVSGIDNEGRIISDKWKSNLARLIKEEREKLSEGL